MLNFNSAHTFFSEGAKLELSKADHFKLKYKLQNKDYAGLVIPLDETELGDNFAVEFEICGDPRTCKFECKLASKDTVWWIVKPDFKITKDWQSYSYKRRHFVYAWGSSQEFLASAKQIELVITANENCEGSFELRNIKLTRISSAKPSAENTTITTSSGDKDFLINSSAWISDNNKDQKISVNFKTPVELGGLIIHWGPKSACNFTLKIQDAAQNIKIADRIENFKGGSTFHYLPDCEVHAISLELEEAKDCKINSIEFMGASFSASWNVFLSNVALRKARGLYPRYFYKEQSFWTVVAEDGSLDKALINQEGLIELGYNYPSLDPFIKIDNQLFTWAESIQSQTLYDSFIPKVERRYPNFLLNIKAWMHNAAYAEYEIVNTGSKTISGSLLVAIRPYQVNPPWQFLNTTGGFRAINDLEISDRDALINQKEKIYSLITADNFFANQDDSFETSGLKSQSSKQGTCSGCFEYFFEIGPGQSKKWFIATENKDPLIAYDNAIKNWKTKFSNFNFSILEETVRAQLLYIFSNRSGSAIQPGTRCYRRTWIRDGAMTSSALLQFGFFKEVKEFIEWFAPFVDHAVPCVVDSKGIDTTPEHDSHGEFLFLVSEYYRYSKDRDLVERLFDKLLAVASHIEELSSYSLDKAPHLKGLLPKSISHEGYAANPAYSYWDDLWAVKGLQGLAFLASEFKKEQKRCEQLRDRFTKIVLDSLEASMLEHKINFIPGAADLGDFDATSTTIGADPCTLLLEKKRPALKATFERYWELFTKRENNFTGAYTPYEIRVIGTFVRLGEVEKAWQALDFFLTHRRPIGWQHWAEVVFADENEPGFLGDAPHGWVASDFLRAIRSFALYELAGEYYLGAGITKQMWQEGLSLNLVIPEGIIQIESNKNEISIHCSTDKSINKLGVWLMLDKKFTKVTLPFHCTI